MTSEVLDSADPLVRPGQPESDAAIELVEARLGLLFNRIRLTWKESAARVHPSLQPTAYKMLTTIARKGPMLAGELAELMMTDKSVISRQLRVLHELGFVEFAENPDDRRARVVTVTALAQERINAVRESNQARFYSSLGDWTHDELASFADMLDRLTKL